MVQNSSDQGKGDTFVVSKLDLLGEALAQA